ncbi:DUF1361 domain-containing protein [Lacinutrix sp. Bg11-31]|uniref:DUF1361 domain-containing protein n=1 Tax=Lacinutrix sp. Bg11-31 TaxID=2057808 RepID=UPI000C30F042|nr:DUF1361 domain-containing protein [Lacinutrix sp. Bg11-31]AUC80771.1 hypothetical protein CW733_00915 [Lacinutrix sp. Bg11-31]
MKPKIHELKFLKKIGVSNIFKTIFPRKQQSVSIIFMLMLFSFAILFIRVSITKTLYYTFLVWNVFLAVIPYIITMYFLDKKKLDKVSFALVFFTWLAFLPNAPYIITDLFHLSKSTYNNIWIDTLVISTFAITGMLLFYFSLFQMKDILLKFFNRKKSKTIIITTIFLSAFGVYIGRFLRYNSWEILSDPFQLFNDIINMLFHPIEHKDVWLFTFSFGLFLQLGYSVFKHLKKTNI